MKYKTKPIEIEAHLWNLNVGDLLNWQNKLKNRHSNTRLEVINTHGGLVLYVHTLEGTMKAKEGDYIICGLKGELYFCDNEIFEKKYELVKNSHDYDDEIPF